MSGLFGYRMTYLKSRISLSNFSADWNNFTFTKYSAKICNTSIIYDITWVNSFLFLDIYYQNSSLLIKIISFKI